MFKEDLLYILISTQQPTLLNIGCFWQYFPMAIVVPVNLASFFKLNSISSVINLSGTISVAILCSCYMLNLSI